MKKIVFVFILIGSMFLTSCNKDNDSAYVVGDVYVFSQTLGEDVVYGLSIHAYSLDAFSSVSVVPTNASDITYNLAAYPGYNTDFYYDTPEGELSTEKPATGIYHFTATFDSGEILETDDVLYDDVLLPPVITECQYDVSGSKAVIEWEAVDNADAYVIRMLKGDNEVFLSNLISPSYNKVEFDSNSSAWGSNYSPENGTNFTVELFAYKYESEVDGFNLQASTKSEDNLLWGQEE